MTIPLKINFCRLKVSFGKFFDAITNLKTNLFVWRPTKKVSGLPVGRGPSTEKHCPAHHDWDLQHCLSQWFPTGVPRHTRVPQRGVRGSAKFGITVFLLIFLLQKMPNCHFWTIRGAAKFFLKTWRVLRTKKGWKTLVYLLYFSWQQLSCSKSLKNFKTLRHITQHIASRHV